MTRRPRPPGEQPSLRPWVYVCLGLIATLLVVQFVLVWHGTTRRRAQARLP